MGNKVDVSALSRSAKQPEQDTLFDLPKDWESDWRGLPEFTMLDATPSRRVVVNFLTSEDCADFQNRLGTTLTAKADSMWWPPQDRLKPKQYVWRGTPSPTSWPVYIPSKGRSNIATTPALLEQAGVQYRIVVEPQEEDYKNAFGSENILVLPFSNLGQGSIPARNWIWEDAVRKGCDWHWILDDNILGFWRATNNRRLVVERSSAPLRVVEDFTARYTNIAFAGLSADGFCPDRSEIAPFTLNTRVYSVTLINSSLPYRWRGKYNEDTDICLRALKDGWSTVLLRAFLMKKAHTARSAGQGGMAGGNTDNVYNTDDFRMSFAKSLQEQHPDVVRVVWKFGRWHHEVDYSPFKRNKLSPRDGITLGKVADNYGLELVSN